MTGRKTFDDYEPVESPEGSLFWDQVGNNVSDHNLWTILDCEGVLYVVPGVHVVNAVGFAVTELPWESRNLQYKWEE